MIFDNYDGYYINLRLISLISSCFEMTDKLIWPFLEYWVNVKIFINAAIVPWYKNYCYYHTFHAFTMLYSCYSHAFSLLLYISLSKCKLDLYGTPLKNFFDLPRILTNCLPTLRAIVEFLNRGSPGVYWCITLQVGWLLYISIKHI